MKTLEACQIDFVMFLMNKGFPHLAMELIEHLEQENAFPASDVLACTKGVVFLEGLGKAADAGRCFARALEINPVYPQAARLAATYSVSHSDAVRFKKMFFDSMAASLPQPKQPKQPEQPKRAGFFAGFKKAQEAVGQSADPSADPSADQSADSFPRFSERDKIEYEYGQDKSVLMQTNNMLEIFQMYYYEMDRLKNTIKELGFGSLITEIVSDELARNALNPSEQELVMASVRNCVELCIVMSNETSAKQKEYMQYTCPADNSFAKYAVQQAEFYLENFDPYDVIVINWKASELRELERYEECIALCDQAIDIQPTGYYFHYINKAMALSALGKTDQASQLFPVIAAELGDPDVAQKLEAQMKHDEHLRNLELDDIGQFHYHYIEGASYAAKDELDECINADRVFMLQKFTENLGMGYYFRNSLRELLTLFTPALIYYFLNKNAIYTNIDFIKLLSDEVDSIKSGFVDEMSAELCWTFAISHTDYQFFSPLREKLFIAFHDNETIALALRRISPPLHSFLQRGGGRSG
jgi:tetratricopeptide (TPR) repeat protein